MRVGAPEQPVARSGKKMNRADLPDIELDLARSREELSELLTASLVLEVSENVRPGLATMLGSPLYAVSVASLQPPSQRHT